MRGLLLLAACLCLFAALALVANAGLPERATYTGVITTQGLVAPELNALAPPFTAAGLDGEAVSLLELRGKTVIINFWATWCGPCAAEMPALQALYDGRLEDDVRIVGVNLGEDRDAVARWAEFYGLTFDLVFDPQGQIAGLYQLRGQPSTYIVSPAGIITDIIYGPAALTQLQAALPPSF